MAKKLTTKFQVCSDDNSGNNTLHLKLADAVKEAKEELDEGYHGLKGVLHICEIREVKQVKRSKKKP